MATLLLIAGLGLPNNLLIENRGQVSPHIAFYTLNGIVINHNGTIEIGNIKFFLKNSKRYRIYPQFQEGEFAYVNSNQTIKAKSYRSVRLKSVYDGIDLVINGMDNNKFEFYFEIKPYADVEKIKIITNISPQLKGDSVIIGNIVISNVKAFSGSQEVKLQTIIKDNEISYNVTHYDKSKTLIIDPIVAMLVSAHNDIVNSLAYDTLTNSILAVGCTNGSGAFSSNPQTSFGGVGPGYYDVFITKLSSSLNTHIQTTFMGSVPNIHDCAYDVKLDANGNVYVAGMTEKGDSFPTSPSIIYGTVGNKDAFLAKFDNSITNLMRVLIFASPLDDEAFSLYIKNDKIFITGYTSNTSQFTNIAPNIFGTIGNKDAFVISIDTFFITAPILAIVSSSGDDISKSIVIDNNQNVLITGYTSNQTNFAPSRTLIGIAGGNDAFITKLNSSLNNHLSTIILASSNDDYSNTITLDSLNNIFIGGQTKNSSNFSSGANIFTYGTLGGVSDAFVAKLDNSFLNPRIAILTSPGSNLLSDSEMVKGIIVDKSSQFVYAVGFTHNSSNFTPNQTIYGTTSGSGQFDAFLVSLNNDLSSLYKTYIYAGSDDDYASYVTQAYGVTYIGGYTIYGTNFICNSCSNKYVYGPFMNAFDGFVILHDVPYNSSETKNNNLVYYRNGYIVFNVNKPTYLGFDVYDLRGRLVLSKSIGYVLGGEYKVKFDRKGVYVVMVKVGDEVRIIKVGNYE
ncbi:MAG: hypothetical protein ABIL52_06500 [candidate division WOR-3 bacterium]